MPPEPLTELERRVLAHLPEWVEDEAAFVAANPTVPRAYDLATFTAKLADDPEAQFMVGDELRPLGIPEAAHMLELAVSKGQAEYSDDEGGIRSWRKTEAGREALEAGTDTVDVYPGPVELPLHPGKPAASNAQVTL